ncbi:MAG TPA: cytochrome c oxidase subunit II [Gaiellaceae bacterium]
MFGGAQSTLTPHSHAAADVANLFWVMMGVAFGGLALIVGMLVWSRVRRGSRVSERATWLVVVGMGVVFPLAIVSALFVVSDALLINVTDAPAAGTTALTVDAIGHDWYWEFRYPGTGSSSGAVTADEMHMPVDTPVNLVATTADVIHSFWVPELNRKIDTIPGQRNRIELDANAVGVYRGQCAEFCGIQHAHMSMVVVVQTKAAFATWLRNEEAPARAPATAVEREGESTFSTAGCASCHAIRGTSASGYVGPDLTHLGSRSWLAGLVLRNTPPNLARWISEPQQIKPGNEMPDLTLSPAQLHGLVAYLESLK